MTFASPPLLWDLVVVVPAMFCQEELEARVPRSTRACRNFVKRKNFLAYNLLGISACVRILFRQ